MLGPLILTMVSLAALLVARDYGLWSFGAPGAGLLPCLAAAALLVSSLLVLRVRRSGDEEPLAKGRFLGYGAGLLVLPPAIVALGMLPALGLFVLVLLRAAERVRWRTALAVAVASTALSWLLFVRLLHVPLPGPALW